MKISYVFISFRFEKSYRKAVVFAVLKLQGSYRGCSLPYIGEVGLLHHLDQGSAVVTIIQYYYINRT